MKAVILAGGMGTRLSEETHLKPKPLVEIGQYPIIWHIMKIYSHFGINEFVICCGYKGHMLKEFFLNYALRTSDISIGIKDMDVKVRNKHIEDWNITLADTGLQTMTGGRLLRIRDYIDGTFCLTYGDSLSNVNLKELLDYHKGHNSMATVTAVYPPPRYGSLKIEDDSVTCFKEKVAGDQSRINGGYFVLEPEVLELIDGDGTVWEEEPISRLILNSNLRAYRHDGFWHPMDTLYDVKTLNSLWDSEKAPWKLWK